MTGQLEGAIGLTDSWELECVNYLIDRKNMACYYKDKYQVIPIRICSGAIKGF